MLHLLIVIIVFVWWYDMCSGGTLKCLP